MAEGRARAPHAVPVPRSLVPPVRCARPRAAPRPHAATARQGHQQGAPSPCHPRFPPSSPLLPAHLPPVNRVLDADHARRDVRVLKHDEAKAAGAAGGAFVGDEGLEGARGRRERGA